MEVTWQVANFQWLLESASDFDDCDHDGQANCWAKPGLLWSIGDKPRNHPQGAIEVPEEVSLSLAVSDTDAVLAKHPASNCSEV